VGDGAGTTVYHVDNNVSNSRFRLVGTATINHDLTLGTRLEMAFTADESSKVSQKDQAPGTYLNARWADISLASKKFGKLSLGKGNTASYLTAASDLSKTDIVLYSSVADIAGGLLIRKKTGQLTGTALADVFTDYDGLNVKSRLRYDSPVWYGFHLAGSIVSNQRSDFGLYWGGEGGGFQGAAGFGLANPKLADSGLQYDGSFSLLHTASGLNLTLSSGMLEKKADRNAFSFYGKLGWLANLTNQGSTAFGIDLSRSENSSAPGDRGISVGAAVVQEFKQLATELYLQYRVYSLKMGDGTPVYDINVGTLGVRVKF
jgi:predicted porin